MPYSYYKGNEAEQYTFYRMPKLLFTDETFKKVSCEAKVLYGMFLDRMSLSRKNGWIDEENRVYICYSYAEIRESLGFWEQKCAKLMKELEQIGLIDRKRIGLGRSNVIYVKNFLTTTDGDDATDNRQGLQTQEESQNCENHNSGTSGFTEEVENTVRNENKMPGTSIKPRNCENHNSGTSHITIQELPTSQTSNTYRSKTDINKINTGDVLSINPISQHDLYRQIVCDNIDYTVLVQRHPERELIDELVEMIVDVMTLPPDGTVRIQGTVRPVKTVKGMFMKLDMSHIEYVMSCIEANTGKIHNIRSYLLTTLYNAPMTMKNYFLTTVNHDLYGEQERTYEP